MAGITTTFYVMSTHATNGHYKWKFQAGVLLEAYDEEYGQPANSFDVDIQSDFFVNSDRASTGFFKFNFGADGKIISVSNQAPFIGAPNWVLSSEPSSGYWKIKWNAQGNADELQLAERVDVAP